MHAALTNGYSRGRVTLLWPLIEEARALGSWRVLHSLTVHIVVSESPSDRVLWGWYSPVWVPIHWWHLHCSHL